MNCTVAGGKNDVAKHSKSEGHKKRVGASSSSTSMTSFFVRETDSWSEPWNDTICACMALKFNVDRCCGGAACVDDHVLQQAKKATYTYNQAHKTH